MHFEKHFYDTAIKEQRLCPAGACKRMKYAASQRWIAFITF